VKKQILQLQHELIGLNVHLIPFWLWYINGTEREVTSG
jgi:hypothetical protein